MAKHGLYEETPHLERDEHGKLGVKKGAKPGDAKEIGDNTHEHLDIHVRHAHERREMHVRHIHEHLAVHSRHQHEHHIHDGKPKHEMHARHLAEIAHLHEKHENEHKSLHTRHEKELGATGGSTQDEPIEKIEKGAK